MIAAIKNWYARWKARSGDRLIDDSHLRQTPERRPLHWVYTVLFATALVSVMWKHCHPTLTIFLLLFLAPLSLPAYLPYKTFSFANRFILQLLLLTGAVGWAFLRLKEAPVFDVAVIETLAIVASSFLMCRKSSDYGYLFLISIFFFVYGALLSRVMFLFTFGIGIFFVLMLLYCNRTVNLSGDSDLKIPNARLKRTWFYFVIHFLLTALFFWYLFALMPMRESKTNGLFEVSFATEKDSMLNPDLQAWLNPKKMKKGADGPAVLSGNSPDVMTNSGTPMNIPNAKNKSNLQGNGGAGQGEDLVFRLKSPLKLYHLAQLYDAYDGHVWTVTNGMKNSKFRNFRNTAVIPLGYDVELKYSIRKFVSNRLYAPFCPLTFSPDGGNYSIHISQDTFYGARILAPRGNLPLPFNYKVISRLTLPASDIAKMPLPFEPNKKEKTQGSSAQAPASRPRPDYWQERLPKTHYMQLPAKKISSRVRNLAKTVTKDAKTPYEKALALRDYLRKNYPYKLNAEPTPKNKESADFFLFELKEGHCEYFATALVVLARSIRLPARIATGFSPGNYNTMDNFFEVYEYHAHAWTQIFIEDMGWLTFDATPPSQIVSRTTPLGIGSLRDPFGDEWQVTPPEITEQTRAFLQKSWLDQEAERRKKEEASALERAMEKAAKAQDELKKKISKAYENKKVIQKKMPPKKEIRKWYTPLKDFFRNFNTNFQKFILDLQNISERYWKILLPSVFVLLAGAIMLRMLYLHGVQRRILRNALTHIHEANSQTLSPDNRIRHAYCAVRLLLKLGRLPRLKNQELLDYASSLKDQDLELSVHAWNVFEAFYRVEYGGVSPDHFDVELVLQDTAWIQNFVYERIQEKKSYSGET